ncbi:MAG: bifunctional sulfur transferase/dioxygenase Blh [Mixta calida]|uniref:bifunctional sulfur transferase/dioxygenase Blh n=1 Tax=Mixta calida TaxID=665913 RepID=UPI002901571F|nr:bifunctional sulfur transferase/dioxygenase Blh [Mixta calida]MDU3074762.1 bifunctional sulfur transferase/dioxygenase Blh [Mixta calida]MDU6414607.1 bifunctional sulfur transferase/dioxygenase Blh [Mixta calida]
MQIRHHDTLVSFSDALSAGDFERLQQQGYSLIVNNRPDAEPDSLLSHQEERELAAQCGMDYVFLPFTFDSLTWEEVYAFHYVLRKGKKTLAHCRSGSRSASLFLLYELHTGVIDEATFRVKCAGLGADAEKALEWFRRMSAHSSVPEVHTFYEPGSGSLQYVIADPLARRCAIIDPVLDFDRKSGAVSHHQAAKILSLVEQKNWQMSWVLDTHPHADHFSAAAWLAQKTGAMTGIGEKVSEVQTLWKDLYHLPDLPAAGSVWDALFRDGDLFYVGNIRGEVILSPGHTLASVTYHIGDCAFIHDTFFMPDSGTARADFPGGSAEALWDSLQRILSLPEDTRLFTGHDYRPGGREMRCESSVQEQRGTNPWVAGVDKSAFVALRTARDATLPLPELMLMALQVNIRGGHLPDPEQDGQRYLKIPLNRFTIRN